MTIFQIAQLVNHIVAYHQVMVPAIKARISVALDQKNKKMQAFRFEMSDFDYAMSMIEVDEILEISCGAL